MFAWEDAVSWPIFCLRTIFCPCLVHERNFDRRSIVSCCFAAGKQGETLMRVSSAFPLVFSFLLPLPLLCLSVRCWKSDDGKDTMKRDRRRGIRVI